MASWPPPQYGDDPRRQQQQYDPNAVYMYAAAPVQPQYVYATPPPPVAMHHHQQQQQAPQWGLPYVPSANWTDDTQSTTTYASTPSNYDGYGSPNDTSSSGDSSNESSSSSSSPVKSDSSGSQIVKSKKRAYHDVPADHTGARNSPIYGLLPPKHSYQSQKEERDALAEEVKRLQARVEELRQRAGLPTANDKAIVASVQARNFDFEENIHATRLHIGRMHSMVTRELLDTQLSPLSTFIHLPSDPSERTALLRAMRELKLRRAHEAAVSFLELNEPSSRIERYTAPDGRHHCNCFAVDVYEGLQDARQLYDALLLFFSSLEVHVTQATGQLAMRDHDPDGVQEIDPSVWHQRIVTSADEATNTIGEEINAVGFTRFLGRQHDAQLGVIAYDTVDMDDLYPYSPLERTRKDIHACYVVTECPKPNATRGETLVVLKRCMFITQHPPTFPVTPAALENLHEHMPQWFDVMTKYLKTRMAAERSPG